MILSLESENDLEEIWLENGQIMVFVGLLENRGKPDLVGNAHYGHRGHPEIEHCLAW